ncbi:MAG: polysaccharide biosynthesis protein [Ruminococcaceae bacterium]|nr:polysaccharide biosynthesis protein [Oscillospiraceae bacterium]
MQKRKNQGQSLLSGAMLLMFTTTLVHVINIFYKIPITNIIGEVGRGYFTSAYELYTPIYAISMAGLPIAVSKMISERMATGRYREVRKIRNVAKNLFLITGIGGTLIILALAYPFSHYIIGSPNTFYSILLIAPSIFFCCMMSTYRGYYEGLRNMAPTGFSQVFETIGKLVFGILLSKIVLDKAFMEYSSFGTVFGKSCAGAEEVVLLAAPYSSAAAISGVTIGTILGLIYLVVLHRTKGDGITSEQLETSPNPDSVKSLTKKLFNTVVPVATSALVLNITNLIDTTTVQARLKYATLIGETTLREIYPQLDAMNIKTEDIKDFLYGCYGIGLDFRGLIPSVVMTLGISAIPVLSASFVTKDHDKMENAIRVVIKTAIVLAAPAGFVMGVLSEPLLKIMYPTSLSVPISAPFVAIFGYFALLISISAPINNMLQAIGRADVPVKSLIVGATAKIICNFILVGIPSINIFGAPIGTLLFYFIVVGNNLRVLLKETGTKLKLFDNIVRPIAVGVLTGGFSWLVFDLLNANIVFGDPNSRLNGSSVSCLITLILSVIIWAILLPLFKVLTKNDIISSTKGQKMLKVLEKLHLIR